jgi:hypothetical protein
MIRSNEDPVTRMAKLLALLHYFMSKEIIAAVGEERGKELILSAIKRFGQARLKSMVEEARERGLDPKSLETYQIVRDMPGTGWERDPDNSSKITFCPMDSVWAEYGEEGRKLGYLYCSIDHVMFDGFNADLERPHCRALGDEYCEFHPKSRT